MARGRGKEKGRNFYETTSPFEAGGEALPATADKIASMAPGKDLTAHFNPSFDAKRYSNPTGMPGVALIQQGDEKSKLPYRGKR